VCFGLSLDNALEGLKTSQMRCFNMFDLVGSVCEAEKFQLL